MISTELVSTVTNIPQKLKSSTSFFDLCVPTCSALILVDTFIRYHTTNRLLIISDMVLQIFLKPLVHTPVTLLVLVRKTIRF